MRRRRIGLLLLIGLGGCRSPGPRPLPSIPAAGAPVGGERGVLLDRAREMAREDARRVGL